jgi:hypothetical protein
MSGYVAMARDWQEHDIFDGDEFSRRDAWAWLISQAAWKPATAKVNGLSVRIERGELCFSQRFMAEKWGWSKSRVDRFIQTLKAEGMLSGSDKQAICAGQVAGQHPGQVAGQPVHVLSVCNFDKYQSPRNAERGSIRGNERGAERAKEEEYKPTFPNGKDGEPSGDPLKDLFDLGVTMLKSQGHDEKKARSIIGSWRKGRSPGDVVAALVDAKTRSVSNLVEWMPRRLNGARSTDPPSYLDHLIEQKRALHQ